MTRRRIDKAWPKLAGSRHLGKRTPRVDGPDKVTGRAKYTYDVNRPGMLYAKFALAPVGRAKVTEVDVSAAAALPGVVAAKALVNPGDETRYAGYEVAVVAAETEEAAREGAARVRFAYEMLPHNVRDDDPSLPEEWQSTSRPREDGQPDEGFAAADVVVEGHYGSPIITHCSLEPHGSVFEMPDAEHVTAHMSTQRVSGIALQDLAGVTGLDAANIRVICEHLGGGFGAKFQFDVWDREALRLAEATGRPVKAMIERDHDQMVAGSRPSAYADVKIGVKRDGTLTAWQSHSYGSGGDGRRGGLRLPYLFEKLPSRTSHTTIATNTGSARPWRAPNHPQMCLITFGALEDAAAAIGMDPLELVVKNLGLTGLADTYAEELAIAAEMIGWKEKWRPRGSATSPVRRGLGLAMHAWGGRGHDSNCRVTIRNDGTVEVASATQDLGVGTRTVLAVVVAETLGLDAGDVRVRIGDSTLPPSGASGGSTTVGGVSSASRVAAIDALAQLFARVAPELGGDAGALEAAAGVIRVQGDSSRALSFKEACAAIGQEPITGIGRTDPDLIDGGVGGVQMAEVEVDVETGVVRMVKLVAVQDCGTVVDLTTAESQVLGACIMGISSALFEERVMDPVTGACLNPDLDAYRLAGIGDVGEIQVHLMQTDRHHDRGVIGIGEPPVISPMAAISNAVANAAGVRVPRVPLTPQAVLTALGKGGA